MFRLFANLFDNAIKYTPDKGAITVDVSQDKNGVTVIVADSGPGIPPEQREKALQRFARLDSSRTAPGSGLGLALVAAITRLHNATLKLEDNEPGLRVVLAFPQNK